MNISGNVRNTCNEASGMTCARREAGARRPAPPTSADSPRRPEPRPGRARARLFRLLPALALLLGALSLFHAAPAAAQTTVTLSVSSTTVNEGSQFTVTVTTSSAVPGTSSDPSVSFPLTVTRDSAESGDLNTLPTEIVVIPGATSGFIRVIAQQDTDAQDEKVTFSLGTLPTGYTAGTTTSVTVTIVDDEPKPTVTFTTSTLTVTEGSRVQLRATRSAAPGAVDIPLTVDLGTAETGDLNADHVTIYRTNGLPFGTGSSAITVIIDTNLDLDTDDETFTLAIDTAKLAELGYAAGTVTSVTVAIDDDGARTVSLSAAPSPVAEGSSVTVTATLSKAADEDATIPVTVSTASPNTAESDDVGTLTSITVSAGSTAGTGTITTNHDADAEDETFTVSLGSSLPSGVLAGSPASVEVTIQDDEFTGSRVTLWAPDKVDEGGRPFPVSATLSEPALSDVEIRFTGTLGTAELADFTAESQALFGAGLTATIPAGKYTAEIELATEHDDKDDGEDETFTVSIDAASLPSGTRAGTKFSHTVTIDDDDRLNPDPDLLTGLTLHDGLRELFFMPNRADDAVGLGGPAEIYTVQVSPGRRWIDVTAVWTNPAITSLTGRVRYHDSARSDGGTLTWSSSGEMERLDMQSPLGGPGHPLLTLTVNGARGQPYRFYFQHNFEWKNANDMLERLYLRFRSSQ